MMSRIKVLIVDDSAAARLALAALLSEDGELEVAGTEPTLALASMAREWPDVILLYMAALGMDDIAFLEELMAVRPTPVLLFSPHLGKGAEMVLQAVFAGAVSVLSGPDERSLHEKAGRLIDGIKAVARPKRPVAETDLHVQEDPGRGEK
ncbi:response regulator [Zobellella iuensis]|uniref:Response regulator n=1 Tax=Zobellella iuensis TaxID=2803811 RepID=A0ABS1QLN6_9GAMM|nr:response regulator [Zobellella iuensis]MBL1375777.1 response regulator [Zobellella iuensis]